MDTHEQARERLARQVAGAVTLEEIAAAWTALKEWVVKYPEDKELRDGFEQLAIRRDMAEEQEQYDIRH